MKKISTMQSFSNEIFKEEKLTIGLDLGDRWSFYCVLDEAKAIEKMIDTMRGHWHGWRESTPSCWGRCGIAVQRRKSI
jgi:hypothetical protein